MSNWHLVANTDTVKVLVDYKHQYALNEKVPFAGSVKADYKLNEDGTLSEASGEVQEQTLATIAGLFPISDLIKTAAGASTKLAEALAPEVPSKVSLQFKNMVASQDWDVVLK